MSDNDEGKFREIFDRLRETEAQTREQNTRLKDLCDRLETFSVVTDKFFELEDKRHSADDERFKALIEHEKHLTDAADAKYNKMIEVQQKREENFWKMVVVLIGAFIVSVLGPKVCVELYKVYKGDFGTVAYFNMNPICPPQDNDNSPWNAKKFANA